MKTYIFTQGISLLLILLFISTTGVCQLDARDSLTTLLKTKSGTERIDILFEISKKYADQDNQKAFHYAVEGFGLAIQGGDTTRIVKLGRAKAQIFRRLGEIDSAINLFYHLIPLAARHNLNSELASLLNGLGTAYVSTKQYDKALKHLFDALIIREKEGNVFYTCSVLNNIGVIYYDLADFEKGLSFFMRAAKLKKDAGDESELDLYYSNISMCYAFMKEFNQAQLYIDWAMEACNGKCSTKILMYTSFSRGIISFYKSNFLQAERELLYADNLSEKAGDERYRLNTIEYLLQIYTKENRFLEAEKYLNEAVAIVSTDGRLRGELHNIYYQAIKLFKKMKHFDKMSSYQDKYIESRDEIISEKTVTNLMKIEAEFIEREYLTKIESQNKILSLNEEVIHTHKFLNIFIGIVALLFFSLIVVLIKSNRLKQKHNMLLDKKVQERTHQLQLNHDSLQRASQERDILLQKISTDINNALVTLKGLCALGMKDLQDPHALEYISKMNTTSESFSKILAKLHFIRSGAGTLK